MKINGVYKYKSAIRITPKHIKELDDLLLRYYSPLKYKAKLLNSSEIEFDNVEELFTYENPRNTRITEIVIYGNRNDEILALSIYIKPRIARFAAFGDVVDIDYMLDNNKDDIEFRAHLDEVFKKMKESFIYCILSKFSLMLLLGIFMIVSAPIYILGYAFGTPKLSNQPITIVHANIFALGIFFGAIVVMSFTKIWALSFPPIVFDWGEETKRVKQLSELRNKILWGILIATILAVVIPMIF